MSADPENVLTMTVFELITALSEFDRDLPVRAHVGQGPLQPVSNPQGGDDVVVLWCVDDDRDYYP